MSESTFVEAHRAPVSQQALDVPVVDSESTAIGAQVSVTIDGTETKVPFGSTILQAAERSKSVVQVGTQNRSNTLYQKAREMVTQGMIGDIHYVRAFWYRNSLDTDPAWRDRTNWIWRRQPIVANRFMRALPCGSGAERLPGWH